jgi:hypothetical protein
MVLLVLLGVLAVLMFLCISNFLISPELVKTSSSRIPFLAESRAEAAPPLRIRFAMLPRGVTKAIGTVFGKRPTGRKVTESAAVALMTSRFINGLARMVRLRFLDRTF